MEGNEQASRTQGSSGFTATISGWELLLLDFKQIQKESTYKSRGLLPTRQGSYKVESQMSEACHE
jgi:hypothetical protein